MLTSTLAACLTAGHSLRIQLAKPDPPVIESGEKYVGFLSFQPFAQVGLRQTHIGRAAIETAIAIKKSGGHAQLRQ